MKLKDLLEQYGEYEIYPDSPKHIEGAFKDLDSKDDGVLCLCVKKPKLKSVWDLDYEDCYVRITGTGGILECEVCTKLTYERQRDVGNVFLTEEDAKKDLERRKVETLLLKYGGRRWFKNGKENWFVSYDYTEGFFRCVYAIREQRQGTIYFDTEEQLKKAFSEIGEERIKEALFEVR